MVIGRLLGWLLIGLAVVTASADAVLALGPAEHAGIATSDVVTLLSGRSPASEPGWGSAASLSGMLLDMPAWMLVGTLGVFTTIACRKRPRRRSFRAR